MRCGLGKLPNQKGINYLHFYCVSLLKSSMSETLDSTDGVDARRSDMIYTIEDTPSWYLCVFLGLQVNLQTEQSHLSPSTYTNNSKTDFYLLKTIPDYAVGYQ